MHDGARERREGADDETKRDEQNPEALEEQVGERLAHGGYPQGQDAAGREEAGQRHHEEVRDHPEGGKLAEVEEHHGSHPQLGAERYGQGGGDRAGAPRDEPRPDPRTEMEQAGRRRERKLETGLHQAARVQGQEHQEGRRETVPGAALATQESRGEEQATHDGRPQHGRLPAHHRGERDEGRERQAGCEGHGNAQRA